MPRFSDAELTRLREEFEAHRELQEERWEQLAMMVEQNTQTTREIAESVRAVADSTAGVVRLYEDIHAAARVGAGLQRFILWVAKWGTVGTGVAFGLDWVVRHFMPPPGS
jgi:hypothetical protein